MNHAITANDLSIKFTEKWVLRDISFEVRNGNIFGLLGPFGASIYRQPPQHRINQDFFETRKLNLKPYNHMVNVHSTQERAFFIVRANERS